MAADSVCSDSAAGGHVPVLSRAAIAWLRVREDGVYVDCTAGAGGHAFLIASALREGRLIALDRDPAAVEVARARLAGLRAEVFHRNYGQLAEVLGELGIAKVDGVLCDAGLSSMQLDDAGRGFTFQENGPLDMRMDTTQGTTAERFLAEVDERELVRILKTYGDIRPARRIASAIVARRKRGHLHTTGHLAGAVSEALDFVQGVPRETRTVFQAIRMAVNDETGWLEEGLRQAVDVLAPGGRLVAVSFHSGEDRIIKNVLRETSRMRRELHADGRVRACVPARMKVLTPKPIQPDEEEIRANPRCHSAKLRAAERLKAARSG